MTRRVVITGIGVRAPGSPNVQAFWELLTSGRSATRRISSFDPAPFRSRIAGECDFDPVDEGFSAAEIGRLDRAAQLALACVREAVLDSGADFASLDPCRTGVSFGSAAGVVHSLESDYSTLFPAGDDRVDGSALFSPHIFDHVSPGVAAAEIAWAVRAEGPVTIMSDGCTSGLDALGHAGRLIAEGSADVMMAGASDTPVTPTVVASFDAIKATSVRNDTPSEACRPFDANRDGFVLAEGAAILVLEEYGHARRRGARVYAEVTGYATRLNAYHMTGLRPESEELSRAITAALKEARIAPESIDYVNAHGSGTRQNDIHETAAFKRSLGGHAYRVPVSSIKSMIGHSLGAIGALEAAACVLAIDQSVVPPTANLHEPDPECDLDYVPITARERCVDTVLTVGSGFGGFQTAMVLRRPEREIR